MNSGELIIAARARLGDTTGSSTEQYWTDGDLVSYANAARDRLFLIVRKLAIDSTTASDSETVPLPLCSIPLLAGIAKYAISTKILAIIRMKLTSQQRLLEPSTADDLDRSGDWQSRPAGEPQTYCIDLDSDSITFVPAPKVNGTASLTVYRLPLAKLTVVGNTAALGFREEYHEDLIPWIMHLAFRKQDSEVYNPGLAEEYRKTFLDRAAEIKLEMHRKHTRPHGNRMLRGFSAR